MQFRSPFLHAEKIEINTTGKEPVTLYEIDSNGNLTDKLKKPVHPTEELIVLDIDTLEKYIQEERLSPATAKTLYEELLSLEELSGKCLEKQRFKRVKDYPFMVNGLSEESRDRFFELVNEYVEGELSDEKYEEELDNELAEAEVYDAEILDELEEPENLKYKEQFKVKDSEMEFPDEGDFKDHLTYSRQLNAGKSLVEKMRYPDEIPAHLYSYLVELYSIRQELKEGSKFEKELLMYVHKKLSDERIKEIGRKVINFVLDNNFDLNYVNDYASVFTDGCEAMGIKPVENLLDDRLDFGSGSPEEVFKAINGIKKNKN